MNFLYANELNNIRSVGTVIGEATQQFSVCLLSQCGLLLTLS